MPSKLSTHGLGRGPSQILIDAGAVGGKWVASDPPANLPDKFIKVWRWVSMPDSINHWLDNGNPEGSAKVWWDRDWPHTKFVPAKPNTYISGPNESNCENAAEADYHSRFWIAWMKLAEAAGYKAAIFSFGTGRPSHPVWDAGGAAIWNALKPALRYAKSNGHVVDIHAYHESVDESNMLRHQSVWAWLPPDCRPQIVIGEWGIDGAMGRFNDPLFRNQVPNPNQYYMNLAAAYDARMRADPHVLLVTLFTEGTNQSDGWKPFDIAGQPVVEMMAAHIRSLAGVADPVPVPQPQPPTPPQPQEPPMDEPRRMIVKRAVNVRVEGDRDTVVETLPAGQVVEVYGPAKTIDGWEDRAFIDPPRRHAWLTNLEPVDQPPVTGWAWPVDVHRITQAFGAHPEWYAVWGLAGHEGADLPAGTGDNIYAAHAGIVSVVDTPPEPIDKKQKPYGNHVRVKHAVDGKHYTTVYAHLSRVSVKVGDAVTAGQMIGKAGSTGNSTGPHLHFGMYEQDINGRRLNEANGYKGFVDPAPFLP